MPKSCRAFADINDFQTIQNFKPMANSIDAVYLVEASPALREAQKKLLCGDAPMTETSIGYQSTSKYANLPIIWTENIRFVPSGMYLTLELSCLTLTKTNRCLKIAIHCSS